MPRATLESSAEQQAERLAKMEEGKLATAAHAFLQEPLLHLRERAIAYLINSYRSGHTEHDRLLGAVAELATLDNIVKHLANVQLQGEIAANKEFNNA